MFELFLIAVNPLNLFLHTSISQCVHVRDNQCCFFYLDIQSMNQFSVVFPMAGFPFFHQDPLIYKGRGNINQIKTNVLFDLSTLTENYAKYWAEEEKEIRAQTAGHLVTPYYSNIILSLATPEDYVSFT